MAAADIQWSTNSTTASLKPIIEKRKTQNQKDRIEFNPVEHLAYEYPEQVLKMTDIGYSEDTGVSPVAVSQPFRLFSPEAIQAIRDEVLSEEVLKNCSYKSNIAACQLRGYASKYAPFVYDAWNHPETLAIVSKIAGVDLVPNMNYEIGHVNISVKSKRETQEELAAINGNKQRNAAADGVADRAWEDEKPVVDWHTDSYPFVCVLMLSDCTSMIGGETALRTGNGDVIKVRGPQMGCAVVLQGRYIAHQALRALGAQERITMVTSFRPKSPHLPDDSVLSTVRAVSDLSQLYYEFARYRLEILEERIRIELKRLRDHNAAGKETQTRGLKAFLSEQEMFVKRTNDELVPNEDVIPGQQPEYDVSKGKASPLPRATTVVARAKLA